MGTPRRERKTLRGLLDIGLFGGARFTFDQRPWRFAAPPRTLPLLAYLILQRDRALPRDVVAFALWPDDDEATARTNLRRHLHYLRGALPSADAAPWVLVESRSTLQWNPAAPCSIDVADFERLSANDASLESADRLYAGDLLPDVDDDWILGERERLRAQELNNLTKLILSARRDGDLRAALRFARRLLALDPWREDAVRHAMELHYALGDRAAAIAEFESFASRLQSEMAAEPMPETVGCYESLRRDAPVLQPAPEGVAERKRETPKSALPFVGRENELAQLHVWWTRAARGNGALGLIAAEAGIGKTRLLDEFAHTVESEGGRVLLGTTSALESFPYQAVLEALDGAASIVATLRIDRVWLAVLAELLPQHAERFAALEPPGASGDVRARLFEAIFQVLKALAVQRPTLLIVEDLHWAGDASVDLLEYLARRISRTRLLVVGSYRDEEIDRAHALRRLRKGAAPNVSIARLALGPLGRDDVEELVKRLARRLPVESHWPEPLYARSQGNPLFIAQLIAAALERETAVQLHEALPAGIRELVRARLERLSGDARSLALMAAVAGDAFDVDLLQEVTAWDAARIATAMHELLDRRIVRDTGMSESGDYAFSHHLIEASIYAEASAHDLTQRHERVGLALHELYPARRSELSYRIARHFERGARPQRAAGAYADAARFALARFAYDDAATRATSGLALATSDEQRRELLLIREEAHARRGDPANREVDLDELWRLVPPGDLEARSEVARRRINLLHAADRRDEESAAIDELGRLAELSGSAVSGFEAIYARARLLMLEGQSDEAATQCDDALRRAIAAEDVDAQVRCHCLLADIFDRTAQFPRAHDALAKAEALSNRSADPAGRLAVLLMSCRLANWQNRYDDLADHAQRMLEVSAACGDRGHEGTAFNALGVVALYRFAIADARRYFERSIEIFEALNRPRNVIAARLNQTLLLTRVGCLDEAIALGAATKQMAQSAHAPLFEEAVDSIVAEAHLRRGDVEEARGLAHGLVERSAASGSRNRASASLKLARCHTLKGEFENALARIDDALPLLEVPGLEIQRCDALGDRAWAQLRLGDLDAALHTTRWFLPALHSEPARFGEPEALFLIAARVLEAANVRDEAEANFVKARAIYRNRLLQIPERSTRERYADLWFHRDLERARC